MSALPDDGAVPSREEVLALLQREFRELRGSSRTLRLDDRLTDDLGVDSLQAVEMVHAVEDQLDIMLVGDQRLARVRTVGDLADLSVTLCATAAVRLS